MKILISVFLIITCCLFMYRKDSATFSVEILNSKEEKVAYREVNPTIIANYVNNGEKFFNRSKRATISGGGVNGANAVVNITCFASSPEVALMESKKLWLDINNEFNNQKSPWGIEIDLLELQKNKTTEPDLQKFIDFQVRMLKNRTDYTPIKIRQFNAPRYVGKTPPIESFVTALFFILITAVLYARNNK